MPHTQPTILTAAAEALAPELDQPDHAQLLAERDAARADLDLKTDAIEQASVDRPYTPDERAIVADARRRLAKAEAALLSWSDAMDALNAATLERNRLGALYDAAEKAENDADAPEVAYPAILTVTADPVTLTINGTTQVIEAPPYTYKDHEVIDGARDLTPEAKADMHAALTAWESERDAAREASGYAALLRAEQEADTAWQAGLAASRAAFEVVMLYPVATSAELAVKTQVLGSHDERVGLEQECLEALAEDAARLDKPTTTSVELDDAARFLAWEQGHETGLQRYSEEKEEQAADAAFWRAKAQEKLILTTPPTSLVGAIIKLRTVLHPTVGLFSCGEGDYDETAIRQVLEFFSTDHAVPPPPYKVGDVDSGDAASEQAAA